MFDRFTSGSVSVLINAVQEAKAFSSYYCGTEHLLLSLLTLDGVPATVLGESGLKCENCRSSIESLTGQSFNSDYVRKEDDEEIPFSENLRKAFDLSWDEAKQQSKNYIEPEELLRGLLRVDGVRAREILRLHNIDAHQICDVVQIQKLSSSE